MNLPFTMRQLQVFASLCETRSFSSSAEALGISQASISSQMKMLEEQLGLRLLSRQRGRRPSVTAEGMAFLDDLRNFESAAQRLANHRRQQPQDSEPRQLRLLVGQGLWDNYIRPRLDRFLTDYPHIRLEFDVESPDDYLPRVLTDGPYDFALLHVRVGVRIEPQVSTLALLPGGVYGHRKFLGPGERQLDSQKLSELPFVLPTPGTIQEKQTLDALARHGISPRHVVSRSRYYDVIATMLERGVAAACSTDAMLLPEARESVVRLYPLDDWRLIWFAKDNIASADKTLVQDFLLGCLRDNERYVCEWLIPGANNLADRPAPQALPAH